MAKYILTALMAATLLGIVYWETPQDRLNRLTQTDKKETPESRAQSENEYFHIVNAD